MSPKNKKKLNLLRKRLDKLDYRLLKTIKKRTEIVQKVLSLKLFKNEIVDKKRITTILKNIRIVSKKIQDNGYELVKLNENTFLRPLKRGNKFKKNKY